MRTPASGTVLSGKLLLLALSLSHTAAFVRERYPNSRPKWLQNRFKRKHSQIFAARTANVRCIDERTGPFDPCQLKGFWGRRPLVVRQAFVSEPLVNSGTWPSFQDILDLDADEEVCSDSPTRLITHRPGELDSFALQLGCFTASNLEQIDTKWTLVVNDVDRYVPALSDWMNDAFHFLPRWRRDDAQVSVAPTGGGIGPHVDNYDVFLLQTSGRRQWQVSVDTITVAQEMGSLLPDLSVRILPDAFELHESVILEPGDLLYLPPRFVHCGTSLSDDCVTLSVGCRSPSAAELLTRLSEAMTESVRQSAVQRYVDPNLQLDPREKRHALTKQVKDDMKELVVNAVMDAVNDVFAWDELVGKAVTEPKRYSDAAVLPYSKFDDPEYLAVWGETPEQAVERVASGYGSLRVTEGISVATSMVDDPSEQDKKIHRIFLHGDMFEVCTESAVVPNLFDKMERGKQLRKDDIANADSAELDLLVELVASGYLYPTDDE